MSLKKFFTVSLALVAVFMMLGATFSLPVRGLGLQVAEASADAGHGGEAAHAEKKADDKGGIPWKGLFAALAIVGTAFCTALAQMKIGGAGAGAIAERPETAGIFIALVAIPETIVILGFVIAAMLIMF